MKYVDFSFALLEVGKGGAHISVAILVFVLSSLLHYLPMAWCMAPAYRLRLGCHHMGACGKGRSGCSSWAKAFLFTLKIIWKLHVGHLHVSPWLILVTGSHFTPRSLGISSPQLCYQRKGAQYPHNTSRDSALFSCLDPVKCDFATVTQLLKGHPHGALERRPSGCEPGTPASWPGARPLPLCSLL